MTFFTFKQKKNRVHSALRVTIIKFYLKYKFVASFKPPSGINRGVGC